MELEALTKSQRKILPLIARGCPNKEIATLMEVSESTVKAHVKSIIKSLGVHNRTQAAIHYWQTYGFNGQTSSAACSPDDLRAMGWTVAVHNDYKLKGVPHTFWLFVRDGRAVKGEGLTDVQALNIVREQLGLPIRLGREDDRSESNLRQHQSAGTPADNVSAPVS